jgi:flagellar motor switch protein FliN
VVSKRESTGNETLSEILSSPGALPASAAPEAAFEEVLAAEGDPAPRRDGPVEPPPRPELVRAIQLGVRVELGRRTLPLKDALRLDAGSVIDLERSGDDPVDLYVHDQLLARGVVLVVDDRFCVRITEVLPPT